MCKHRGWIVQALAGREKNQFFCVVDEEAETGYLLLADGKRRKIACPKRKKKKHVILVNSNCIVSEKRQQGQLVSDRELRRTLAAFKEGITRGER